MLVDHSDPENSNSLLTDLTREKTVIDSKPTLYICHNYQCERPAVDIDEIQQQMENVYHSPSTLEYPVETS